jgi:DNA-binding CsgD family transcriptional regulator
VKLRKNAVELIERAYAGIDLAPADWLHEVRGQAEQMFDGVFDLAQVWEFQIDPQLRYRTLALDTDPYFRAAFHAAHAVMPRAVIKRGYLTGPVPTLFDTLGKNADDPVYQVMSAVGVGDMAGAIGVNPTGRGVAISWFRRRPGHLSREVRHTLGRIAAHMASACRLRATDDASEEAVVAPDGKLVHAEGDARDLEKRDLLRAAALRIDRARTRAAQSDFESPAALWEVLVDGRWSLVERFESDGRRYFIARRNRPGARKHHALTANERQVVALAAIGRPSKVIAYELGLSEGTVSRNLARALEEMGLSSRADLLQLHGAIVSAAEAVRDD